MSTKKLTKKAIDAFKYEGDGKSRDIRWDTEMTGLGLRLYPSGRKAFVLSYRASGRKRLMTLGNFGVLTLEQARTRAKKHLVAVEDGKDPLEERRQAPQGRTFGELIDAYVEDHAKVHKKTWLDDKQRLERHIPAAWKSRRADAITRYEVVELHREIGRQTPYEANRLQEILRKMFSLAQAWHFIDEGAPNPAQGITRFREHKRKRWLKPEELPALVKAIDAEANVYVRAALWLYLLSGVRKTELVTAKWTQVDWNRGLLALPETKSGEEQDVVLNAPALAILQSIPKVEGNPYIFVGAKPGEPLTNIDRYWRQIRQEAGIEDVRLHDLRRTTGSWLSQAGVELNTIKEALRHASLSTTLTYARLGADPARAALEEHGRKVMEIAGRQRLVEGSAAKE
jgi:integrase